VFIKALLMLLLALLGSQPTAPGQDVHAPGECRMLAQSRQPTVSGSTSGTLVAVIPATTCNTPRSQWGRLPRQP
jgi:hypothetical protein